MYSLLDGMRCNSHGAMVTILVFTPMPFFGGSASVMFASL
jgi:hypothetical protein